MNETRTVVDIARQVVTRSLEDVIARSHSTIDADSIIGRACDQVLGSPRFFAYDIPFYCKSPVTDIDAAAQQWRGMLLNVIHQDETEVLHITKYCYAAEISAQIRLAGKARGIRILAPVG